MDDIPAQDLAEEPNDDALNENVLLEEKQGLSRRDFVKIAAILTGSTLLVLSRCKQSYKPEPLEIPHDFKRFILIEQSPAVATEKVIVAMGSQCPDMNCALWWADDQEFQFYNSVDQIIDLHASDGRTEFFWLD